MNNNNRNSVAELEVHELEDNFLSYIHRIEDGETLIILKDGKPMAEIKPLVAEKQKLRPFGLCIRDFVVPDDFNEPLPEQIIREFEGK